MTRPADLSTGAPDEADALRRAERLFDAASQSGLDLGHLDDTALGISRLACQRAPYLATLLIRDPGRLLRVAADPYLRREKPYDRLAAELVPGPDLKATLSRLRGDELVRLGVRELELGLRTEVGRELAHLADVCFDHAIRVCNRDRDVRLAVIGMGKLGGEELNFSSDVDVIYIHAGEPAPAAKLCQEITAAMAEFRVDLRLRPEGGKGPIARSLESIERYYETFGRPWERQAWLKARLSAGDRALGAEIFATLEPFVYPRVTSPAIVDDVRELNRRIKRELVRGRDGFDLKNGEGGIREIEFFVQALQLIHAGKQPALRQRGTLPALDALLFAGLVTDDEHDALSRAYRWLRHAEHLLQLEAGLQTQQLPADRELFARRLGYADAQAFDADLATHTSAVSRLFATLGAEIDPSPDVTALLDGDAAALSRLGFVDVSAAQAELARARRPGSPLLITRVGGPLLREVAASADPDQALRALGDLIARRGEAWSIWALLAEQPAIVRLLGSILGASAYLARTLVDTPELIDLLVDLGQSSPSRTVAQIRADLDARLAKVDREDPEAVWSAIAEVKNGHVLRVGLADFAGALDPLEVCVELTAIAEACLQTALAIVATQLPQRSGALSVLALGKLGGHELGYAADLDVVFVHSGDDDSIEHFSRIAQRLLGALRQRTPRGRLYEVDTRLRPSGTQGLLVSSLPAWRRYHEHDAHLWERQALIKLRPVAGDAALGEAVARHAEITVYGARHDAKQVAGAILAMKTRIERELGGDPKDLKIGAGGVMDVEFAAQYLQLAHGHDHPSLRTTGTSPALRAAAHLGIAPAATLELLDEGYRFLRGIEHRLRVVHDQPIHTLPEQRDELARLARRCGYPDGTVLLERVARWQHDIRAGYLQLLGA